MMDILDKTKRYLWAFVEIGFAGILAIMLIYLILGPNSGVFVLSVADNVTKFAAAVPTPSLIGLALILGLAYLIMNRLRVDGVRRAAARNGPLRVAGSATVAYSPVMRTLSRRSLLAATAASLAARAPAGLRRARHHSSTAPSR